ncbi:MAG: hypothetical protein EOQ69_31650 [Mesorhizobium sp.]|nr:MAG: hypothetical protein EOQ69_31650 [Mesorhizobium sp.]
MGTRSKIIAGKDITRSVADALQYISYYHPPDYIRSLSQAQAHKDSGGPCRQRGRPRHSLPTIESSLDRKRL